MTRVCAVDLGATSGRVSVVDAGTFDVREVHRFATPVLRDGPSLRWDFDAIVREVRAGIDAALATGPVASIGIDTWGVDYGLVDGSAALVAQPFHYRDARTDGWRTLVDRVGERRLYELTGLQLMQINTLFQLAAHDRAELEAAAELLMLPELVVRLLGGDATAERTSAGTSQLVDLATGDWSGELVEAAGVPRSLLQPIAQPGTPVGRYAGVPVHLVAGHDTASAVATVPDGHVFVSLGTWAIVGVVRSAPDTSERARAANFSNEAGVAGTWRFLRNVTGLWLVEELRRSWGRVDVEAASALPEGGPVVDVSAQRFLAPRDMERELRDAAGLRDAPRPAVVRCALDSIAAAVSEVALEAATFADSPLQGVRIVGGGSRIALIASSVAARTRMGVSTGPAEATTVGNAMVQSVALGVHDSLRSARSALHDG